MELKLLLLEFVLLLLELKLFQSAAGEARQAGVAVVEGRGAGGQSSAIGW